MSNTYYLDPNIDLDDIDSYEDFCVWPDGNDFSSEIESMNIIDTAQKCSSNSIDLVANNQSTRQNNNYNNINQQSQTYDNEISSQPYVTTWFDNNHNQNQESNVSRPLQRRPKTILPLSEKVQCFKNGFYNIFTNRKKFKKEYVVKIHNNFLVKNIKGFQKIKRSESRSIDTYFQKYAPYQDKIYPVLREKKKTNIKNYFNRLILIRKYH